MKIDNILYSKKLNYTNNIKITQIVIIIPEEVLKMKQMHAKLHFHKVFK